MGTILGEAGAGEDDCARGATAILMEVLAMLGDERMDGLAAAA